MTLDYDKLLLLPSQFQRTWVCSRRWREAGKGGYSTETGAAVAVVGGVVWDLVWSEI